uniref:exosome complex component RRP42 isoform X2 n=1 Tax=Myodes glareolus TaxID=447135 RepID=UPI0020215DC8|nr:exosome complex component RRP42 isoform X2 [Myodes glareolus]
MASVALSEAEKVYIVHGVQEDLRVDGRGCEDYRCVEVETDVVSNTSGSARVKLGHTDILVGVKAEMGTPKLEKPNEGYLEFFVDWSVPCRWFARKRSVGDATQWQSACIARGRHWVLSLPPIGKTKIER